MTTFGAGYWEPTGNILGTDGSIVFPVPPFQPRSVAFPVSLPAQRPQATGRAVLVGLCPEGVCLLKTLLQHLADGDAGVTFQPRSDDFLPGVAFVSINLLIRRHLDQLSRLHPPDSSGLESLLCLRP